MRLQNEFLTKWIRNSVSNIHPCFYFYSFIWENTSLHSPCRCVEWLFRCWSRAPLSLDNWWWMNGATLSGFLNPARQQSATEILRISGRTSCFDPQFFLYYLSFMTLIQETKRFLPKIIHKNQSWANGKSVGEYEKDFEIAFLKYLSVPGDVLITLYHFSCLSLFLLLTSPLLPRSSSSSLSSSFNLLNLS